MSRSAQVSKQLMAPTTRAQVREEPGALIRRWPGTWAGRPCPQRSGLRGSVSVRGLMGSHCDTQSSPRQLGFDFLMNRQLSLVKCLCCHLQHLRTNSVSVTTIWLLLSSESPRQSCFPSLGPAPTLQSKWIVSKASSCNAMPDLN